MAKLLILLIFLLSTACSSSPKKNEIADLHLQLGSALLQQGRYPQALAELLTAESHNPKSPMIQNNLGLAYYMRGKPAIAEKHLRNAIALDPKFSEARNNLAKVLAELSKYDEAITQAELVIEDLTYPTPEKAYINKGIALFGAKKFQLAQESFKEAIKINRDSCLAQSYYGRSLFELEQFAMASKVLDSAVSLCRPQNFDEPHYYSALSFYKLGDSFRARARFNEVIEFYPNGKYADNAKEMLNLIR